MNQFIDSFIEWFNTLTPAHKLEIENYIFNRHARLKNNKTVNTNSAHLKLGEKRGFNAGPAPSQHSDANNCPTCGKPYKTK